MIYIVTAGEYEENRTAMVTTDIEEAINYLITLPTDDCTEGFASLEAWKDSKTSEQYDSAKLHFARRDNIDIKQDIINHFKLTD